MPQLTPAISVPAVLITDTLTKPHYTAVIMTPDRARGAAVNSSRWTAILLLFFLAVSAIAGAIPMIVHPHGNPLGMPQTMLRATPFSSFFGPGILLLVFNGLLALWCLFLVVKRKTGYGGWTAFQGIVLLIWLVVECLLLHTIVWAHYLYGVIGAGLLVTGSIIAFSQQPQHRNFDY